ncbi:helix-turn-helix domain-containing protein [Thioclava sp. NG1]|uniref:helix-turn-helix domain-containing protein n=1 Tax=Thioclava sp. NG1 TaxID=2182426 RepID=UPI001E40820D|nr:helix-turn-helix domain-containing protein [Thioclava sp. NG1]
MPNQLITIDAAAEELGIPKASLRTAAEEHGFIVRMGRAIRLERDSLAELIRKCRDQRKARASTSSPTARTGTSAIPDSQTGQRAARAAQTLKKRSQPTSPQKGGQVTPLNRGQ